MLLVQTLTYVRVCEKRRGGGRKKNACVDFFLCIARMCECVCACVRERFAIAALEGTDGRGKWTPVPEDYCGAQDQSAAYVPPWASVTHYSTWSPSSTGTIMDQPPAPSVS